MLATTGPRRVMNAIRSQICRSSLTSFLLLVTCSSDQESSGRLHVSQTACSIAQLRRLLAIDTTSMLRVSRTIALGDATEGSEVEIFLDKNEPRILHVTYYGETGRAQEAYYLADSESFVRIRREVRYSAPVTVERTPRIQSSATDSLWACNGQPILAVDSATAPTALRAVHAMLRPR